MGRNARLKKERREERQRALNEAWAFFTSRHFLLQVRRMIHDAGVDVHSSVACTKVYCELAEHIGLDAKPLSVETTVFNPVFADYIEKNGLDPSNEEMTSMGERGGRYVVLGSKDESRPRAEGAWLGHLVAVLSAKGKPTTVVDLTVDKAHRPTDDIVLVEPLIFGCPQGFIDGEATAEGFIDTPKGRIALIYRARPEDRSFEEHPEWSLDYGAKTHDKIEIEDAPTILGPNGLPLEPAGE